MIVFTMDIDWAPESVIRYCLEIFEHYQVKCTIFATHHSKTLMGCSRELFEIAVHPNFNPILERKTNKTVQEILNDITKIYPEAKGVRCHSMTQNTNLLNQFALHGFIYEANHFLPYWDTLKPYQLWNGLIRIPYNWEDDIHFLYGKSFEECGLNLSSKFNVLDFHPVHIFLNTDSSDTYANAKPFYKNADRLMNFRNKGPKKGVEDLLQSLLQKVKDENLPCYKMIEVAQQFSVQSDESSSNR